MNNQNLNSLVSRMLANAKENKQQETMSSSSSSSSTTATSTSSIKRNLFGIRLNHDQLKQDLKEMWQEQLERKKREWNFDFETLKPLGQDMTASEKPRFEWNKIKTTNSQDTSASADTSELVLTTFDTTELYQTDLESSDEEEDDDALAVPAFYKYQRRQKLNNGFKFIQIESTTSSQPSSKSSTNTKSASMSSSKPTAFSKLKQQTSATKKPVVHKPKAVKSKPAKEAKQQNLIITYSENRKDTLRSACTTTKSIIKSKPSESAFKPAVAAGSESMKQQSLLDMLKQRKRKTTNVAVCQAHSSAQSTKQATSEHLAQSLIGAAGSIAHNLRPRTISSN